MKTQQETTNQAFTMTHWTCLTKDMLYKSTKSHDGGRQWQCKHLAHPGNGYRLVWPGYLMLVTPIPTYPRNKSIYNKKHNNNFTKTFWLGMNPCLSYSISSESIHHFMTFVSPKTTQNWMKFSPCAFFYDHMDRLLVSCALFSMRLWMPSSHRVLRNFSQLLSQWPNPSQMVSLWKEPWKKKRKRRDTRKKMI